MSGTDDKLVYMANQIATAFRAQEPTKAAQATCDHIRHFWDPRMRARIIAHRNSGAAPSARRLEYIPSRRNAPCRARSRRCA